MVTSLAIRFRRLFVSRRHLGIYAEHISLTRCSYAGCLHNLDGNVGLARTAREVVRFKYFPECPVPEFAYELIVLGI